MTLLPTLKLAWEGLSLNKFRSFLTTLGVIIGVAEANAVLGQIERTMTAVHLQTIAAMQLTQEDLASWARERGMDLAPPMAGPGDTPGMGPNGTPRVWPGGTPGQGEMGNHDPAMRQTLRAGFESMTEEERAQWMTTAQAGGMPAGRFGQQGGIAAGQLRFLLPALLELLTERAAS